MDEKSLRTEIKRAEAEAKAKATKESRKPELVRVLKGPFYLNR